VALYAGKAWLAGPSGEHLPIHADIDAGVAERLCAAALRQPDRHAALLFLGQALPSLETRAPGLRNEGLFALHELIEDAPRRHDWQEHAARARAAVGAEGPELLKRLGFTVTRLDNMTQLLKGGDRRLALAVLLDRSDSPEAGTAKFGNLSPVTYALTKADAWDKARDDIHAAWMVETDPANLQPNVRPLNGRVADFIRANLPPDHDGTTVREALDILEAPWPRRDELLLRDWFAEDEMAGAAKAQMLVGRVRASGLAPFRQPPLLPPIEKEDVTLVCWMGIAPVQAIG